MTDREILILASLADGYKHGSGMMLDIRQFAGVEIGAGTLYGAITRLMRSDWIRPLKSDDRRWSYRITPAGRTYLHERMASPDQVVKTALGRLKHA